MKTTSIFSRHVFTSAYVALAVLLTFATVGVARADMLTRQLEQGMSGADVSTLQTFLATDVTIYPQGLVTGFFGPLTFSAVSNFQSKNGIARVGRVGPITLAAINARLGGSMSLGDRSAPLIKGVTVTTSQNTATISWSTNEAAIARLYYDVTPLGMAESQNSSTAISVTGTIVEPVVPGLQTNPSVNLVNLQPNTTYYYAVRAIDASGNVGFTWPTTFKTQ